MRDRFERDRFEDGSGNGIVLFVTGLFMGAAVALLLAPQTGRESREQIWGYGRRVRDRIGEAAEEISGQTGDMLNRAGETFNKTVEKGREYVQSEMPRSR
jgi:gas vesicle protein